MVLITWQDSYSVGVELIDNDHKLLVSLINQLNDASEGGQGRDVVGSVLNVLVEYTNSHFSREEMLMAKGGYPDLVAHQSHHRALSKQVHEMVERYRGDHGAAVDREVLTFLRDWLTNHILGVDMHYRPYVENVSLTQEEMMTSLGLGDDDMDESAGSGADQRAD